MASKELALFLAHSVELETEARERYEELAESMAQHHNEEVAAFFMRMAAEADHHLGEVAEFAAGLELPELKPWEFAWPDAEPPETAAYEGVHYRMSLHDAMELALQNERYAHQYYQQAADRATDQETGRLARRFAEEELSHAAQLESMMKELGADNVHRRVEDDDPHMPE